MVDVSVFVYFNLCLWKNEVFYFIFENKVDQRKIFYYFIFFKLLSFCVVGLCFLCRFVRNRRLIVYFVDENEENVCLEIKCIIISSNCIKVDVI